MNPATAYQRDLLVCALQRAGSPQRADELLDAAIGLGLDGGATAQQLAGLDARGISSILRSLVLNGRVVEVSRDKDTRQGREVPTYAPSKGYDIRAEPPLFPTRRADVTQVRGLGRKLAANLAAQRVLEPGQTEMDVFFRNFSNDAAALLTRFQIEIGALVKKHENHYRKLRTEDG